MTESPALAVDVAAVEADVTEQPGRRVVVPSTPGQVESFVIGCLDRHRLSATRSLGEKSDQRLKEFGPSVVAMFGNLEHALVRAESLARVELRLAELAQIERDVRDGRSRGTLPQEEMGKGTELTRGSLTWRAQSSDLWGLDGPYVEIEYSFWSLEHPEVAASHSRWMEARRALQAAVSRIRARVVENSKRD